MILVLSLQLPAPLVAEERLPEAASEYAEPSTDKGSEGFSLLRDGAEILLKDFLRELEPAFRELDALLSDLDAFEAPVVLPNGDILIRRKKPLDGQEQMPDTPPDDKTQDMPDGAQIEL